MDFVELISNTPNNPRKSTYIGFATVANRRSSALCGSYFLLSLLLASEDQLSVFIKKELDMPIGTVKFFDNAKGYGFITNEAGGNDAFVHMTAVQAAGMNSLEKEQRLSYELENDKRGKTSAVNLQNA